MAVSVSALTGEKDVAAPVEKVHKCKKRAECELWTVNRSKPTRIK